MTDLFWHILVVLSAMFVLYKRYSLNNALLIVSVTMVLGTFFGNIGLFFWLFYLLILSPIVYSPLRLEHISAKLLKYYKSVTPEMSDTEKEALDAGTIWWDAELFSGRPNWEKLHTVQVGSLTEQEQAFLDGPCEEVCAMVNEWQINHVDADLSDEIWTYLKENKFFAMIIDKQYGGLDFSAYAQSRVLQKLSGVSAVLSSTVGVPNSLGPGELLQHYGTKEQQQYYLPRLAAGQEIPCFALTSPEAGSDAGAIPDSGYIKKGIYEGKEQLGIELNFSKRYITLAPIATVVGLAFKLYDPEQLLSDQKDLGITCALLPRSLKGLNIGRRHFPLNVPFHNGPLSGENIFIPLDFIIGGAEMAGKGWRMLMECLSVGRCITLPSCSAGGAKQIALATGAYSRIRRQFKLPIGQMEGIEEALARIGANAYLMDAVTSLSTAAIDLGEKPSVISAISKYHLTEKMRQLINDAMDVHGGKGICLGPNNYLGRAYQGTPISITVEGANILTRNMMIFGQGAIRCHPYVLQEMESLTLDEKQQLESFDKALMGHFGFVASNVVSSMWFAITRNRFNSSPFKDSTKGYYQKLRGYSSNLALMTDIAMAILGGSLKRKERLSARLGDVLSYMYLASATLKRFDSEGRNQQDLPFVKWAIEDCFYQIETAIDAFIKNFPSPFIKGVLRILVQPFGVIQNRPSDKTDSNVAQLLLTPNSARDRLGYGQYLSIDKHNLFGDLEKSLSLILECEPICKKICDSLGEKPTYINLDKLAERAFKANLISEQQVKLLEEAELYRKKTINVDDFDPSELVSSKSEKYKKKTTRPRKTKALKSDN